MNEANTIEAVHASESQVAATDEVSIEACAECFELFDLGKGFGWAVNCQSNKIEFFDRECFPHITEETHRFIEWNEPSSPKADPV